MTIIVDAVVLAGGKNSDEMRAATGVENRALVRLGDRTMLEYVVAALRGASCLDRIFVVGDVPEGEGYERVPPAQRWWTIFLPGCHVGKPGSDGKPPGAGGHVGHSVPDGGGGGGFRRPGGGDRGGLLLPDHPHRRLPGDDTRRCGGRR